MENPNAPGAFKSQPWVLYDTLASSSFILGSATPAIGQSGPAISSSGEMVFFQSAGRTKATMPWYSNIDLPGQLSYGMEVWQIYLQFMMPILDPRQALFEEEGIPGPPPTVKLIEAILNFGVLELNLGQENQTTWPLSRFGAGGGMMVNTAGGVVIGQNGNPDSYNVMKLPEPIQMVRTQNLDAKIRLAPEVFNMIGTGAGALLGVGGPLGPYSLVTTTGAEPDSVAKVEPPYAVQLGLVGRRVKDTQYGQVPSQNF